MKNTSVRILMVTVALGSVAVAASAQTYEAKINFAFQAGPVAMPAGEYSISRLPSYATAVYRLAGPQGSGYVFLGQSPEDVTGGERPRLVFTCTSENCVLTQLSTGSMRYRVPHPKSPRDLEARRVEVRLNRMTD